jgi:hypothetical protein
MKKLYFITILLLVVFIVIMFIAIRKKQPSAQNPQDNIQQLNTVNSANNIPPASEKQNIPSDQKLSGFQLPLDRAAERVNKKPFGIYVTPLNSPVQPEKFSGYHTGTDFEIFPEELSLDVSVKAACSGKLLTKEYASGYGGVAVQSCTLNNNPITVIYGHLKLASVALAVGQDMKAGDTLGILGAAYSQETNGERKHLHLGFHKGSAINILGYVQNKNDLSNWIDSCLYVCGN